MGTTITHSYVPVAGRPLASLTNSVIIREAVSDWRANEANRYDDERTGGGMRGPLLTEAAAQMYAAQHHDEAFHDSLVIPLCSADKVKTYTRRVKITVSGEKLRSLSTNLNGAWSLYSDLYAEYGVNLVGVEVVKLPSPRKAVAVAASGKTVTRYVVKAGDRVMFTAHSKAEARAEALRLLNENAPVARYSQLTVEAVLISEGGSPALITVFRPFPESATVELQLSFSEPKPGAVPESFLVAFAYHS